MAEHKSFKITDFTLRDLPGLVTGYMIISLFSVGLGLFLESLPEFWSGVFFGAGCASLFSMLLLRATRRRVAVESLPQPSENVRAKCDDPNCSLAEAAKSYRDETGLGLTEAVAVLRNYRASKTHSDQAKS